MKVDDIWSAILEVEPTHKLGISLFENKKLHRLLDKLAKDDHKALRATVEGWRDEAGAKSGELALHALKFDKASYERSKAMGESVEYGMVRDAYKRVLDLLDGKLPKEIEPTETIIEERDDAR